ncbi:MAG TPA: hypothetical protein VE008_11930 [Burkholderiales bacterium]|nr:hypothetical protein [Burkholderiales bacterium]
MSKAGMLNDDARELLEDFRHYEKHAQHRRPAAWNALTISAAAGESS